MLRLQTPRDFALFVGAFVTVFGLVGLRVAGLRRRTQRLAEVFDDRPEIQGRFFAFRLEGHVRGREVTFRMVPGSRYSPDRFHVLIVCSAPFDFEMRKDTGDGRFIKWLGFRPGIPADHTKVGDTLAFSPSDPGRFRNWAGNTLAALGIDRLFADYRADSVTFKEGTLHAIRHGLKSIPAPGEAREVLDVLCRLAEAAERA